MGGFEISSWNETKVEPGIVADGIVQNQDALVTTIKKAYSSVQGHPLKTKYVAILLPDEKAFLQVIKMPMLTDRELQSAVRFEVAKYIPLPVEKVYIDFQVIGSDHREREAEHLNVLISAMPRQIVDGYVNSFKKAGMIPCIMEIRSQAVVRAIRAATAKLQSALILHATPSKINFIVFSGTYISYTFSFPFLLDSITSTRADSKDPQLESLLGQVKKYVDFYHSHASYEHFSAGDTIAKIVLCGEKADSKNIANYILQKTGIPVEVGNPLVNLRAKGSTIIPALKLAKFTAAIGLALRPVTQPIFTE